MNRFHIGMATRMASNVLALVAGSVLAGPAVAGTPSLSGPSMLTVAATGVFTATDLAPNTSVTVAVTTPAGSEAHYGVMVAKDGTLKYKLKPNTPGVYKLRILDGSGKELSIANVNATH